MKKFIAWYSSLTHDQRKQVATACNTLAAIILVQITFKHIVQGTLIAIIGGCLALCLWYISFIIVKKKDGE